MIRPALVAAGLALMAVTVAQAQAQVRHPAPTAATASKAPSGQARAGSGAAVEKLQNAVSAGEAKRVQAQWRLRQQDREIETLRAQLRAVTGHDSGQPR